MQITAGPIRIGISTCLPGDKVRYDGGHKRDRFLTDTLGGLVEWVPVCPEVEIGMGTPRESIQLVQRHGDIRLTQGSGVSEPTPDGIGAAKSCVTITSGLLVGFT